MDPVQAFLLQATSCLNIPYIWGGSNPLQGFDCSGYAQWVLRTIGMDPPGDQSAQALFDWVRVRGDVSPADPVGSLVFYGANIFSIKHVAILLNAYQIIEAGGGGSSTLTRAEAAALGACIRIRHVADREKEIVAIIKPPFSRVGLN